MALLLEAERQGLMNGDYVFFVVQHFEVSGGVVSKTFITQSHPGLGIWQPLNSYAVRCHVVVILYLFVVILHYVAII